MSIEIIGNNIVEVAITSPPVIEVEITSSPVIDIEVLSGGIVYRGEETTSLNTGSHAASTSLSALRVVIVNADGEFEYASSNTAGHAFRVAGVLKNAIVQDDFDKALVQGLLSDNSWNWTLGSPIYVGINGVLTQTPPSIGFQLVVGKPATSDSVYFEIGEPILL